MLKTRFFAVSGILPLGLFCLCLSLIGCEKSEQITVYNVPKHESLQTPVYLEETARRRDEAELRRPKPKRMIGVIVPQGPALWFFKIEGPVNELAAREAEVREFLKSVKFASPELPEWNLPSGWKQFPPAGSRFATILLSGQPPFELAISQLPNRTDLPLDEQLVANINRWRGQVSLPPIADADLANESEKLDLNGNAAYLVNLVGRGMPGAGGMAPPPPRQPAQAKPVFEKPAEWSEGPATPFATVSLLAKGDDGEAKITVTGAGGDRLTNVNRWRGQLSLEPLNAETLKSASQEVKVGPHTGDLYEMSNQGRTLLGVILEAGGQTWFIKLDGTSTLAERERPRFVAFLQSLHWE